MGKLQLFEMQFERGYCIATYSNQWNEKKTVTDIKNLDFKTHVS